MSSTMSKENQETSKEKKRIEAIQTKEVADLIRYVKNRSEGQSNFSLLLGSGCSYTSDIRTAGELINTWKRELYVQNELEPEDEIPSDYFEKLPWFKKENEYASFFEKLYDLSSHRKCFVEKEITGKIPSIGYGLLVKLIQERFLGTIFTTNFDDLINEAFYTYGDPSIRPIVCAHDSSIKSISPLSRRPKIIKLHGDYLFDNIQTTDKETKFLKENMRAKVEEFASINGLIVIGYGGHDKSVMNALKTLVDNPDYYKYGLFWCVRDKNDLSEDVKKLLLNERCYLVEIDGFDELMYQLRSNVIGPNPIELEELTADILKTHAENHKLLNSKSEEFKTYLAEIQEVYKNLTTSVEKKGEDEDLSIKLASSYDSGEYDISGISLKEKELLDKLRKDLSLEEFDSVVTKIDQLLNVTVSKQFSRRLRLMKAATYHNQKKYKDAQDIMRSLIDEEPYRVEYYLNLMTSTPNLEEKIPIIETAMEKDPYDPHLYYLKAKMLNDLPDEIIPSRPLEKQNSNEILLAGEKLSKAVTNPCWRYYFDYNLSQVSQGDSVPEECEKILEDYKNRFPGRIEVIQRQVDIYQIEKRSVDEVFAYIDTARIMGNTEEDLFYDLIKLEYAEDVKDIAIIKRLIADLDRRYSNEPSYVLIKARIEYSIFRNLSLTISSLERFLEENKSKKNTKVKRRLISCYLANDEKSKAHEFIEKSGDKEYFEQFFKTSLLSEDGRWPEVISSIIEEERVDGETISSIAAKTHAMLMDNQFDRVKEMLRSSIEHNQINNPILLINYELADAVIRRNNNKNLKKRERIILIANSPKCSKRVRAAASIVLGDIPSAQNFIRDDLRDDFSQEADYRKNYVFTRFKDDLVSDLIKEVKEEFVG